MNPCKKIWFYTPAQLALYAAIIAAIAAGMLLSFIIC